MNREAIKAIGIVAGTCLWFVGMAAGQVVSGYEMTLSPDMEPDPMSAVGGGFGDPAFDFSWSATGCTPPGPCTFPTGPAGLSGGVGRFMDTDEVSPSDPLHAPAGFYRAGLGSTFTVDMRVQANWSIDGISTRRSMGIHNGMTTAGQGAGIRLSAVPWTPGSGFIQFFGSTSGSEVNLGKFFTDLQSFHSLRIAVNGTQVSVYDLDIAGGPPWTLIGTVDMTAAVKPHVADEIKNGGGLQIGSMDPASDLDATMGTDFSLDWLRINKGQALGANDPIIPAQPPSPCRIAVTPVAEQAASAEIAGTPTPSSILYTITNAGQNDVNYTVAEVDSAGQPLDYGWLALDKTSGGPLTSMQTDTVTATINSTGLTKGTYTAYLKFTDDCSPANESIRQINLTVTDCRYTVTPLNSVSQGYAIRARNCPVGQQYVFTVSNIGVDPLTYTVEECQNDGTTIDTGGAHVDWDQIVVDAAHWDSTANVPIPVTIQPGATDTVTVTITDAGFSGLTINTYLLFNKDCAPADPEIRQIRVYDTSPDTPRVFTYNAAVMPDAPDSFGAGYSFARFADADFGDPGTVVNDSQAIDGKALRIVDDATHRTRWHSTPSGTAERLIPYQGATIVARAKVESAVNPPGGNISLYDDNGMTSHYSFGGPNLGRIKEVGRNIQNDNPLRADSNYHIIRLTAIGGSDSGLPIRVRLYFDEDPTPVLDIDNAASVTSATDYFGFGVTNTGAVQTISFDWIVATNNGAYAPGEEEACLQQRLCLGPNCYHNPAVCSMPFADADGDEDVDQMDFAIFQTCLTSGSGTVTEACKCFDRDDSGAGDGDIDNADYMEFAKCGTGPGVIWTPSMTPDCSP